jgi:hypothetical protein
VARGRTSEARPRGPTSDRYFDLVREFPLRPIRSDRELDRAIAVIDWLLARGRLASDEADFLPKAVEMSPKHVAKILGQRTGSQISADLLIALASAFAMDPPPVCWRAFQELVVGNRPGTPPNQVAKKLNVWGGGGDCWRPSRFHLTAQDIQALAGAFASESECWKAFRELVEESISEIRSASAFRSRSLPASSRKSSRTPHTGDRKSDDPRSAEASKNAVERGARLWSLECVR